MSKTTCAKCDVQFSQRGGRGRPRKYCSATCRQRAKARPDKPRGAPCSDCGQLTWRGREVLDQPICRDCRRDRCSRCGDKVPGLGNQWCRPCTRESAHGLELGGFDKLLASQGGECAVCGSSDGDWVIDHDHKCCPGSLSCGECVRGVLCRKCNSGLGMFEDDPRLLKRALNYREASWTAPPT